MGYETLIINIYSYCHEETSKIENTFTFNQAVAWMLRRAFAKQGVKTRFINDGECIQEKRLPKADHSIVISSFIAHCIRDKSAIRRKVRKSTKGKLAFYLDADYGGWVPPFDYIFSVVKPVRKEPQYIYAGWGADPKRFYPDQDEKAVFIDSLMYGYYKNRFNNKYNIIKKVFKLPKENLETGAPLVHKTMVDGKPITVYMPSPIYRRRKHKEKILWPDFQKIIRKCHYYCCTQLGESGLIRIESATCGALLVVPKRLYRPRTMASLEHKIWYTKKNLVAILNSKTNPKAIRKKALKHSWNKVAKRILKVL